MRELFLSFLIGGMSYVSQGQALIGMTSEELVNYHTTPAGVTVSQGYRMNSGKDSLIVVEAPYFTTFAFVDTTKHYCTHYSLIVGDEDWNVGYGQYLRDHFAAWGLTGDEWITDDQAVIIESVGRMKIEWDGTMYVGYVYTARLRE